jgi:hypothetical protein
MDAYAAYVMYLALKRHFTLGSNYDYFKYNGKTNASKQSFETRRDRYSFHKLSKKDHPRDFVVANFIEYGSNIWIGDLVADSKYEDTYRAWLKRRESISYIFKTEVEKISNMDDELTVVDGQYPKFLQQYLQKKICIETLIILSSMLGFLKKWNNQIQDTALWPDIYNTCIKYSPFIEYDMSKMKNILIETMEISW